MTAAAQQALRRTMEIYSNTTRFCLACNNSTKIIEAIQSRTAILRYSRLSNENVLECLLRVCEKEKIAYTEDGLQAVLFTAEGDMRHALNNLQAAFHLTKNGLINQAAVFKVCDQPHPKTVAEIIEFCSQGDTRNAVDKMHSLYKSGYSASDIIGTVFRVVKAHSTLPEALKLEYLREIGFTHVRIILKKDSSVLFLLILFCRQWYHLYISHLLFPFYVADAHSRRREHIVAITGPCFPSFKNVKRTLMSYSDASSNL
jgi:replication factor C subunit 2/4